MIRGEPFQRYRESAWSAVLHAIVQVVVLVGLPLAGWAGSLLIRHDRELGEVRQSIEGTIRERLPQIERRLERIEDKQDRLLEMFPRHPVHGAVR